ncbi:MAG: site-specific integrase [Gemmatimonadota bacterium]
MSAHIRSRTLPSGARRHDVIYRRGGRGYKIEHGGTFKTVREANVRLRLVEDWLAAGRNPKTELALLRRPAEVSLSFRDLAEVWLSGRFDLDESTRVNYRSHLRQVNRVFGSMDAASISAADVSGWIGGMIDRGLAPGTVKDYVGLVRMVLDHFDDNPARHRSVRLPKQVRAIREPPDADEFLTFLAAVDEEFRGPVVLLEQTGMRIGEALSLEARDIDRAGLRVRVRAEVAKRDRPRWIPVPAWYADLIMPCRMSPSRLSYRMRKASERINPHLLRHRRATLWHQSGIPAVELASRLGHANTSESLDTYSHVRPISEADPVLILAALA